MPPMGTLGAGDDEGEEEDAEEEAAEEDLALGLEGGAKRSGATFASFSGTCDCANCEFAARLACGGR